MNTTPASAVVYVAGPDTSPDEARALAARQNLDEPLLWRRRGASLGWIAQRARSSWPETGAVCAAWRDSRPVFLPGAVAAALSTHRAAITQASALMEAVLDGREASELFAQTPYAEQLAPRFEMLAASTDEGDPQEIETIEFDAVEKGEVIGENLWCKLSWLSFEEDDTSLRFRFSFGIAGYEDVADDPARQQQAAALTEAIFPESSLISANEKLETLLTRALDAEHIAYVERIVYFNAPNGGAQFHQDVERGHLGVVFAQAHGRTGWLALSKDALLDEIQGFLSGGTPPAIVQELLPKATARQLLQRKAASRDALARWLDETDNAPLEMLLNRCAAFTRRLVENGHAFILEPGDVILLPQHDLEHCAWHSVFCLDDYPGEGLSFAVRRSD